LPKRWIVEHTIAWLNRCGSPQGRRGVDPKDSPFTDRTIKEPMEITSRVSTDDVARAKQRLDFVFGRDAEPEYEVPKWDGDLGRPNFYVPISASTLKRKTDLLMMHFGSQRSKHWFSPELFSGLARLRGMECNAPEKYAEAFFAPKLILT
jgi:hypothetical protein